MPIGDQWPSAVDRQLRVLKAGGEHDGRRHAEAKILEYYENNLARNGAYSRNCWR